jgi:hypothetical protein
VTDGDAAQASEMSSPGADDGADALVARAKPLRRELPIVREEAGLVPARMINEVLYCERLMYLEWIQGEWAENAFTVEGQGVHRRVDEEEKPLREASVGATIWSKSTGERSSRSSTNGVRSPMFRRGPTCPSSRKSARRCFCCPSTATSAIMAKFTTQRIANAYRSQSTSSSLLEPSSRWIGSGSWQPRACCQPPLNDSPKCNGCSLVGICLPDETRALGDAVSAPPCGLDDDSLELGDDPWGLGGATEKPVRRLFPARDDKLPVYVQAQGAMLRLDGERLIVQSKDDAAKETRLSNTSHVALFGNVHVTTPAIRKLLDRGIPLLFFTYGGWFSGQASGHDSKNVELRLAQYKASQDSNRCLTLSRGFVLRRSSIVERSSGGITRTPLP